MIFVSYCDSPGLADTEVDPIIRTPDFYLSPWSE
jgi:hypothetical protein